MGALMVLPPDPDMAESGARWLADPVTRKLVGMAIPSDLQPGKWRAGVVPRGGGLQFVCVQASGESLVELTQVGTETFRSMRDAMPRDRTQPAAVRGPHCGRRGRAGTHR